MNCPNCAYQLAPNSAGYISCSKCGYQNNQVTGQVVASNLATGIKQFDQSFTVRKSRWIAFGLGCAMLINIYGLHNIYLGRTIRGVIQIGFSVVAWVGGFVAGLFGLTGVGAVVGVPLFLVDLLCLSAPIFIWQLVEMFQILTGNVKQDAKGNPVV